MTPLEIEILINYYCCGNDFERLDAPAVQSAIKYFVGLGFLEENKKTKTPKYIGKREAIEPFIDAICSIPLPIKKWVIEN